MKKYLLILVFALVACSEESRVKNAALESAQGRFHKQMQEEIAASVTGKENLQKIAANILTEKTEFEVSSVEIHGERANAVVVVKTIPAKVRVALIGTMAKLDPKKEMNFNVSDALGLIAKETGAGDEREGIVMKLSLEKKDGWKVFGE